ncbi:TPA: hypothetical protein N0F65_008177 [Lagenidium giganteum]|uniref:FHA domain-containing protein n=1 Tax=Lagenidium giganteum TaxID=4803 RepID=A0AAV2YK18_9STRA|nr:TPA: hypothetical protein N0F65_008177 [Lagenidium giganteum]
MVVAATLPVKDEAIPDDLDIRERLARECELSGERLVAQAKARTDELRREFERAKRAILNAVEAEKENIDVTESTPEAYDIIVQATKGPYKGNDYILYVDIHRRKTCLIGRSTGKKFRLPFGLSLPKDSEISTTHAELRMEEDGMVYFVDLDSTNGSRVNSRSLEPREPFLLSDTKPSAVSIGGSSFIFSLAKRN